MLKRRTDYFCLLSNIFKKAEQPTSVCYYSAFSRKICTTATLSHLDASSYRHLGRGQYAVSSV